MPKLGYGYAHYSGSPSSLPSDISGLRLWLKADAGIVLNENKLVSVWKDQSGNKNDFFAPEGSDGSEFLTNQINGKPSVYANSDVSVLQSPYTLFDSLNSFSFVAVCNPDYTSNQASFFYTISNTGAFNIINADPEQGNLALYISNTIGFNDSGINFFEPSYHINYVDATTANGSAYQDGKESVISYVNQIIISGAGTTSSNGTYTRTSGGTAVFSGPSGNSIEWDGDYWLLYDSSAGDYTYKLASYIFDENWQIIEGFGESPAPTQSLAYGTTPALNSSGIVLPFESGLSLICGSVYLSELLIYNKRLSTTERQQVEGYLNAKYAIY